MRTGPFTRVSTDAPSENEVFCTITTLTARSSVNTLRTGDADLRF